MRGVTVTECFEAMPGRRAAGSGFAGLLAAAFLLLPGSSPADSFDEVRACLSANIPERSSAVSVKLNSRHRDGATFEHRARIYWQSSSEAGSDTLLCMLYPADINGLAYLIHDSGDRMGVWGYLPEKQRVVQIHASSAARRARIARTAISYEDLRYLPMNFSAAEPEALRYAQLDGRRVVVVRLAQPDGERGEYSRVVAFVDEGSCVPLKTEFYGSDERLLKVVTADPKTIGGAGHVRLARSLRVHDLKNEVETRLRVEDIEVDGELPAELFTTRYLERGKCR
jgi:hypothetical protein